LLNYFPTRALNSNFSIIFKELMSFGAYKLKVSAKTWKRDSYGLFDYENSNVNSQDLSIIYSGKLVRENHQLNFVNYVQSSQKSNREDDNAPSTASENLINIQEVRDGVKVFSHTSATDSNLLWAVIKQGNKDQILAVGDEIKFGRVKFKITQVKIISENEASKNNKKSIIDSLKDHMQISQSAARDEERSTHKSMRSSMADNCCKICLYDKSEEDNDPLISPCNCIGSVKYVHLKCMQNWVKSKLNMQENTNIVTIFWRNLQCELCKTKLPINLNHHGENLCLIPFDNKITGSYIMMESFSKEKNSTGIHLIDLSSNQNFKIGRGHNCDLKLSDISVSRVHALMVVSKGKVYLKDNKSKFGTLILKKDPFILNADNNSSPWFQCGRTYLKFTLKKPWLAYLPCVMSALNLNQIDNGDLNIESTKRNHDETVLRCATEEDSKKELQ